MDISWSCSEAAIDPRIRNQWPILNFEALGKPLHHSLRNTIVYAVTQYIDFHLQSHFDFFTAVAGDGTATSKL